MESIDSQSNRINSEAKKDFYYLAYLDDEGQLEFADKTKVSITKMDFEGINNSLNSNSGSNKGLK